MSYRFHLDVPLGDNQKEAIEAAKRIVDILRNTDWGKFTGTKAEFQVRLGNDDDRSPKNFLKINENGHASGKKMKLFE